MRLEIGAIGDVGAIGASVKTLQRITRQGAGQSVCLVARWGGGAVHHLFLYLCATTLLYK